MTYSIKFDPDWKHHNDDDFVSTTPDGSKLKRDWSLINWTTMAFVLEVLQEGSDKYGSDSYRNISVEDHLLHLVEHAIATIPSITARDYESLESHLTHLICRALFALENIREPVDYDEF
jgi:hypothetical protein